MTTILDGKKLSAKILDDLSEKIAKLDRKPHLAVILVGENPASELYVGLKEKAAEKIGIKSTVLNYPQNTDEKTILDKLQELNSDKSVDAILVQLPLPKQINEQKVIQAISPKKDADGITPENIGKISIGVEPYAYPCTPKGIFTLLDEYKVNLEGEHAVIVGRSNIVGKPAAQMALNRNATVTICHSHTKKLSDITKTADILISAVGKNKFIKKDMIKNNSVIVDVGTSKINGKTFGDVDFENISKLVSHITPVPGGVGPMTIASLMQNVLELSKLNRNI
ncbi:MAG: tetrahydrofolate dehydrogenase/cyclohydrolase catalytic domain-containing protein [Candidatus Gastranaerophilaceae bacterium]